MAVMDLPQPDSPIRPRVSPRSSWKLTPRTAVGRAPLGVQAHVQVGDFEQSHQRFRPGAGPAGRAGRRPAGSGPARQRDGHAGEHRQQRRLEHQRLRLG
jgi:hypothetical protein